MGNKERVESANTEYLDKLTGIYNRNGFYEATRKLLDENKDEQFCLIYWNIRRFKVINDLFGRNMGDDILIHFAQTLKNVFENEMATYGRVERDNFICCVPNEVIERGDWKKINESSYFVEDSEYQFFTCCGLYKIVNPELSISNMGDKARVAMDTVKNNYLSPYAWYNENMWDTIVSEQNMIAEFKKAIQEKQFKVFYQPICRANDGVVIAAEALVRWEKPGKGLVSPGAFIPLFEKNGFISILDRYVWNEVCRLQKSRLEQNLRTVPISVNVSRVEFYNPLLCEEIWNIVKENDIPPGLIKIEITESAYADNPKQVQEAVEKLHEYGFVVLMDDFGSGYSSLNILKDLPIDILKIDIKFLEGFETSQKAAIIIEAIVRMAKWMNLTIVAEGVETRGEWDYLKSVECDLVQGYYFNRPMPENAFIELLGAEEVDGTKLGLNNQLDLDDIILNAFTHKSSRGNILFYSMLGGMGIFEMKESRLEIVQVNKGYYEVMNASEKSGQDEKRTINQLIETQEEHDILLRKCVEAQEKDEMQQIQIHHKRQDDTYVWLNVKIRYLGSKGKRSLLYFALDNIDEIKKAEQERYLLDYSAALLKIFDKVYRLDYSTGTVEVLHTSNNDFMQVQGKYYFIDFFDKFADSLQIQGGAKAVETIKSQEKLDQALEESKSGSFCFNYFVHHEKMDIREVHSTFFKVELHDGREEYLCCIKRIE